MGLLEFFKKALKSSQKSITSFRPVRGWGASDTRTLEIKFDYAFLPLLYDYAYYSDILRTIISVKTREVFRRGYKIEQLNQKIQIDSLEKEKIEKFLKRVNLNKQSILELLQSVHTDLEIVDNAYIVFLKKYEYNELGEIISSELIELIRADPVYMRKIIDSQGILGYDFYTRQQYFVCPEHREKAKKEQGNCEICGRKLYPAHFYTILGDKQIYYIENEVMHITLYTPTLFYGIPPILSVLTKVKTLLAMDQYINSYYSGQRSPKGLLAFNTTNVDSALNSWNEFVDKVANYPHQIHPIFIPKVGDEKGAEIQYIDFSRTLEEMQYTETRNELINRIGALFGVSPIFQSDISTSGGLNNEGLQILVTTRAVEHAQKVYDAFFDRLTEDLNIKTLKVRLITPEEKNEQYRLQLEAQKIANASAMVGLGYEAILDENNNFVYKKISQEQKPVEPKVVHEVDGFSGEPEV